VSEHFRDPEQILKDMTYFYEFTGKRRRRKKKARG
jgi:hypothetical protein